MMNFLIAALLVLHLSLGNVEAGEDEEIPDFLREYASNLSDYFYGNTTLLDYYTENMTIIPTMYLYEEYQEYQEYQEYHEHQENHDHPENHEHQENQESVGSPLQSHLPLLILLSLLTLLL